MCRLSFFVWAGCFTAAIAAPEISVRTENPTNNMFAVGRRATAEFAAKGWNPGESRAVVADVYDYRDEKVATLKGTLKAGNDGSGSLVVELPTDRLGFFRVRAKAGDLALPKVGTRPAGEFTYGVAISPDKRRKVPQDAAFAGLHGAACDEARWMGAHQAPYAKMFPSAEKRDEWRRNAARDMWPMWGVSSLRVDFWKWNLSGFSEESAKWIRDNGDSLSLWKVFKDDDGRKALDEYIARWTRNYRSYPAFEGRRIYEVFWEPDLSAPDKETVVAVAEYVSKAIKAGDPEGLVAMPTISTLGSLGYHRELFELGLLKHADVFDLHPYVAYPPEQNGLLENVRALKRMLAEYGRPGIPFICTESGYQTSATQKGERLQLDGQVRMQLVLLGEGIWFNCPFFGYDYGGDSGNRSDGDYGLMYNLDYPKSRFGPKAISPRPAFCGLSAFSMLLDGWKAKESVECLGETVLGYVYTNGLGNATLAVWDYGGADATVDLPIGRNEFEVADIMGNRSVARARGGMYSVKLSTSPIYIFDPDMRFWEKGMKRMREAAAAAALARENAPVKLLGAEAAFHGDEPAVDVDVLNNSDEERVVSVGTRILGEPDARRFGRATLGPRERRKVRIALDGFRPDPFKTFGLKTFAQDMGGCRAERNVSVNFLRAEYAPGVGSGIAVAVWKGVARSPVPGGSDDLSAEIGFGWNERFLLVDALVKDDAYRQDHVGWRTWNGDAIQFGFAKARLERLSANDYTDSLAQGTTEIDFALTKNGPEGYRTVSFDPYKWPTDMHGKGQIGPGECKMSIERRDIPEGGVELRYRIALPWRYMNKTEGAKEGESVFLAATFNDRDPGEGEYSAIGVFDLKRMPPRHFGRLFLGRWAMSPSLIVAVAGLVLSGSIGQSQPLSGSPIPWTEARWCVSDSGGVVHLPGGWRVRGGTVEREKCEVEGIVFSDGDGDLFYFFGQRSELGRVAVTKDGLSNGGVVARLHAWDLALHAAPRSCKAGFAASARFFALDRKRREVRGWRDDGTDAGVVFSYAGRDEPFVSLAIHPASGDLLLGTGWPQNRICRFRPGGEEVRDHVWPASGYAMALGNSRGRTWVLGSDAMLLADSNAPSAKCRFGVHANEVRAIAETGKAYFLATTQGVQSYLKADLSRCARRIGGLANVGAVAVHEGRVLVGSGYRLLNFWLDDGPNDAVSSDVKWGVAKKWDERIDRMEVREGVFYIHDEVHGGTTAFDPRITEWVFRKRRQRDADGFDFKARGDRVRFGKNGDYAAVAKGDELRLYRREGGALALVQTLPVKATCIAGEGDWLVAYVPEKKALLRYRLSEQQ